MLTIVLNIGIYRFYRSWLVGCNDALHTAVLSVFHQKGYDAGHQIRNPQQTLLDSRAFCSLHHKGIKWCMHMKVPLHSLDWLSPLQHY